MDPEGKYESRLSYTTKSSLDIMVDGSDPLSEAPGNSINDTASKSFTDEGLKSLENKYEEMKRCYDYFGASAPPLPGVPVPAAAEDTRKPSPVANRETKGFLPPDEPTLDSVVVSISPGDMDSLPIALPIVTSVATAPLPELPETAQASADASPAANKAAEAGNKTCSRKKVVLSCLILILIAGLAATLTIFLWPEPLPDQSHDNLHTSDDDEETIEPTPNEEPTYENTVESITTQPAVMCTKDVKLCPNGSSVARDPANNCSFRTCPSVLIPSCTVNGRKYSVGETYNAPDGCNTCACVRDGEIACTVMACPRDESEPEKKVDEKPSELEMYSAYYNTNNQDGPMNCCKQKSQACCRCCKDECAMKEKGNIDDIPSCKRECRDYYGRDTCSNGDEGPFDCCTSESRSCCRCCMNECGERYKGDLALIEDCKKYVCRVGYYGVRDPDVCKE